MEEDKREIRKNNVCRMIKPEWHFMQKQKDMTNKKLIQKLQQLLDKLPIGKKRKEIRKKLLNLKLGKKQN